MDHLLLLLVTHVWILVDLVSGLEVPYTPDIPIQEQQRRVQEKNPCKLQNNCFQYNDIMTPYIFLIENYGLNLEIFVVFRWFEMFWRVSASRKIS